MPSTLMQSKIEYNEGQKTNIDENDGLLLPKQQQLPLLEFLALPIKGDRSDITLHALLGIELGPSVYKPDAVPLIYTDLTKLILTTIQITCISFHFFSCSTISDVSSKKTTNSGIMSRIPATLMQSKIEYNEGQRTDIGKKDGILLPKQ